MRLPQYLSPSALSKWQSNQEEYYLHYLAENPPPRFEQTQPMSVGSSFDAYVKSYLYSALFGSDNLNEFELRTLFETQVEEAHWEWAWEHGARVFDIYKSSGALADLLKDLSAASGEPRFEATITGKIGGVPLLGKPDAWYVNKAGDHVILDWKVNGYCGNYNVSPKRGYVNLRNAAGISEGPHKRAQIMEIRGVRINIAEFFENIEKSWAKQLATYSWLCGTPVGEVFFVAVDQICCSPGNIKVAEHRCQIGESFQRGLLADYQALWEIINSDHIFRDRTATESAARCSILDLQHAAYLDGDNFIRELTGR